jgi:tetratricopeptide (TPR) repeat protein
MLDNICNTIGDFLKLLSVNKGITFSQLKADNYGDILNYIGYSESNLAKKLIEINQVVDEDEKDLLIDDFLLNNPQYYLGYFFKAEHQLSIRKRIYYYSKCIELNPSFHSAYNNRGNSYLIIGQIEEAEKDYTYAMEICPTYPLAYLNRSHLYFKQGKLPEAISDINKCLNLNPSEAEAYFIRGNIYLALRQYEEAEKDYSKAIELNPEHYQAFNNRGGVYSTLGNLKDAEKDFAMANNFLRKTQKLILIGGLY